MTPHFSNGLARKAQSKHRQSQSAQSTVYQIVTDRIVKALECGVVPWRQPWQELPLPCNAVSQRQYHGINLFLLRLTHYRDHRWLTYRQAEELGGHVKIGEQSSIAVFWKRWQPKNETEIDKERSRPDIPILKFYHLFNVAQCDGLDLPEPEGNSRPLHERIEMAEELVRQIPNPPRFHESAKVACYYPLVDVVQLPPMDCFESADGYYATLFHELGHATGHTSRLNRPGVMDSHRFGSAEYSREELVAELTSAFCSAQLGLDNSLIDNSASYIQGWITALKADDRAIISASAQAKRATDYLQGRNQANERFDGGSDLHSKEEATV